MHFLRLFPLLFFCAGCWGSVVRGEGPPADDDDQGATASAASAEDVQRALTMKGSSGPLFDCIFESGSWTGARAGTRITIWRAGVNLYVGSHTMRIERVDRTGYFPGYPGYRIVSGTETLTVDGRFDGERRTPASVYRQGSANESIQCEERFDPSTNGIFDETQLEELVTLTNGRR